MTVLQISLPRSRYRNVIKFLEFQKKKLLLSKFFDIYITTIS